MSRYSAQQSSISENNRSRILQYLYHNGICSRAQIAKAIKLTPAAITKITAKLLAQGIIERFGVKASGVDVPARALSGGNLQKYIVGREIDAGPQLLILSQPTWGVDVGAQAQIHAEILALRDAGCAVLVVSEELDELFALSDRLLVLARGRLSPSIPASEATVEQLGAWMSGLWDVSPLDAAAEVPA